MSMTYAAVEGVLLALSGDMTADDVTACENGVLLAWLAASKANDPGKFEAVLGQIGWVTSSASKQGNQVPLAQIGATIEAAASQGGAADFGAVLSPVKGQAHNLAAAWWGKAGIGRYLGTVSGGPSPSINLTSFSLEMPDPWRSIFDDEAQAGVNTYSLTLSLNQQVYDQVKDEIAKKVAPYLKDIVRFPANS